MDTMRFFPLLLNSLLIILGLYFTALMTLITLPYSSFEYDVDFLLSKQTVLHITAWRYSFYLHIFFSIPVLLIGFLQVSSFLLKHSKVIHRWLGKAYAYIVLLISAPSGFIMAIYANGGIAAKISFLSIAVLWWWFTYYAVRQAMDGNLLKHRAFMYRSFALTLSAITLRCYVLLIPQFYHLRGDQLYVLVAWLSWLPNLVVAELIIWRKKNTALLE